jgi:membrane protease YdiL (CAAX protease family)
MPTAVDIAFAVLFAVVLAATEALYFDRKLKAQVAAGLPDARRNAYRRSVIGQWVLVAVVVALWIRADRPWSLLGLVPPAGWRLVAGIVITLAIAVLSVHQVRAIRRLSAEKRASLHSSIGELEFVLPHTPRERRWFWIISVTAGVCEEVLYRGYLTWLLASYVALPIAIALAAVAFGLAHAYQGSRGILKTGAVGLAMSLIVVATGWLIPAMVVHALIDISSGELGFALLEPERSARATAAA